MLIWCQAILIHLGSCMVGSIAAMLDVALAMSGSREPAPDDLLPGSTISLTLQYLSTLNCSKTALRWLRQGVPVVVSRYFLLKVRVKAPDGRLIATATGVFKPGRKSPVRKVLDIRSTHLASPANVERKRGVKVPCMPAKLALCSRRVSGWSCWCLPNNRHGSDGGCSSVG